MTAVDTRWLQNVTSKRMGAAIKSPAQVGISLAGSDQPGTAAALPPRGAAALFNAGIAHLQTVEIADNLSETGGMIHNFGDGAELRIEESLIFDNESSTREGVTGSVLLGFGGRTDIVQH